jgi:NAD-dependent SIR2 family protein deacetylase
MNTDELVRCSCCGEDIPDDDEHNVDHGVVPNPHDEGFGMCVACGGDKRAGDSKPARELTESQLKKRIGWAGQMFYETRFEILEKNLTGSSLEKFRAMTYARKMTIVAKMIEKGLMI